MKFAVRTAKLDTVRAQLLLLVGLRRDAITVSQTKYNGIAILNFDGSAVSAMNSVRNIEALLLDEETASLLMQPKNAGEAAIFRSLACVDEREQYEHLSQLLHIQKARRDKR